jgi:hypothetical protein
MESLEKGFWPCTSEAIRFGVLNGSIRSGGMKLELDSREQLVDSDSRSG